MDLAGLGDNRPELDDNWLDWIIIDQVQIEDVRWSGWMVVEVAQ